MRPTILDPLFAPVSSLAGIGPKLEKALNRLFFGNEKADAARLVDLLFHIPHSIIDRRQQPAIADALEGAIVTMKVWLIATVRHRVTTAAFRTGFRSMTIVRP